MLTVLSGFMGSGKTSVGKILADMLGCPFADLDAIVEKAEGKTIKEIFAAGGEEAFRKKEAETLRKTVARYRESPAVLALGGGTEDIRKYLKGIDSVVVWLRTGIDTIRERLSDTDASRPMLASHDIGDLLASRESGYEASADVIIDTDGLTAEEIAQEIIICAL